MFKRCHWNHLKFNTLLSDIPFAFDFGQCEWTLTSKREIEVEQIVNKTLWVVVFRAVLNPAEYKNCIVKFFFGINKSQSDLFAPFYYSCLSIIVNCYLSLAVGLASVFLCPILCHSLSFSLFSLFPSVFLSYPSLVIVELGLVSI